MKFECLTPSQCGIGNDCSKCHEKHVEKLDATIDKLVEVMEKAADVTENASASIFERMDYAQRMRDLINSVTEKK